MKSEESILSDALDQPASDRGAFVDHACGSDVVLRERIMALLRGYEGAGAGLEASPLAGAAEIARAHDTGAPREYAAGMRIGRYRLLQKLGEGGCGVVFMAEQEEPVRRRVALKVIKLGMDTREVIARFEAERQALALMDHPNIARVLDAEQRRAVRVVYDPGPDPDFAAVGKLCVSGEFERRYPAIVQRVVTTLVQSAAWISGEQNRPEVLRSWAISPENLAALERTYAGSELRQRMSPLMDDYFLASLQRDIDDMKRFDFIAADADMSREGWIEPKYLERALRELNLEHFWPELDAEGKPTGKRDLVRR